MKRTIAILVCVAYSISATAQAGSLDPSFGNTGKYIHHKTPIPYKSLLQSDEKIITFGMKEDGMDLYLASSRHLQNGGTDSTYGVNGVGHNYPAGSNFMDVQAGTVQPDDKIIIVGSCAAPNCHIAVVRFEADGNVDSAFGINGKCKIPLPGNYNLTRTAKVLSNGKILVGGMINYSSIDYIPFTAQLNSDGAIDSTYGINGVNILDSLGINALVEDIAIQPDGKVVCVLNYNNVAFSNFYIVRLLSNGSFDNTFGANGIVETSFIGISASKCVNIQNDNKIVVAGNEYFNNLSQSRLALARYLPDGTLDSTFGTGGKVISANTYSIDEHHIALQLQNDQKVLVGTGSKPSASGNFDFLICRFLPDGTPDNDFGNQGYVLTDFNNNLDAVSAVFVRNDEKILVTGISFASSEPFYGHAMARYNSCGVELVTQPVDMFLQQGETAQFNIGTSAVAGFRWQTRTAASGWMFVNDGGQYSGAQTPTLTVTNVNTENNLQDYRCLVFLGKCTTISDVVTIHINGVGIGNMEGNDIYTHLYPNPTANDLTLEIDKRLMNSEYRIMDTKGKNILSGKLNGERSKIDTHSLDSGIYFLHVARKKIIKFVKL